jgi:transcriptional regulator with XRE-family HTH domain
LKQRYSQRHDRLRAILKEARIKAGLKQGELCDLIKRDKNFVSTVELGTRMLDVLEFAEYAEALGRRPTELLGRVLRPGRAKSVVGRVRHKAGHK